MVLFPRECMRADAKELVFGKGITRLQCKNERRIPRSSTLDRSPARSSRFGRWPFDSSCVPTAEGADDAVSEVHQELLCQVCECRRSTGESL